MDRTEANEKYRQLAKMVKNREIRDALDLLNRFQRMSDHYEFDDQIANLTETYRNLLHYAIGGFDDPQRQTILNNLYHSILSLGDELREVFLDPISRLKNNYRREIRHFFSDDPETAVARIEEFFFHGELNKLFEETDISAQSEMTGYTHHSVQADHIFRILWLTRKYNEEYVGLIQRINRSSQIQWYDKCMIVSAITLGLLDYFDPRKILLLIEVVEARENQVFQRALVGLILAMIRYDDRLNYLPEIYSRLRAMASDENLLPEVELILLQLLKARETEKITREFETEVLPEMQKMMPRIEDKLQLNDLADDETLEGKNPGWKDMIEEVPGLFEKIEKFSRLQMEGGDVFMSTFAQLKRFDFFTRISNWFAPFYIGNPELQEMNTSQEDIRYRLLDSLDKAFYICNSDKYSFAINFRAIPDQQRTMILTNFEAEFAQMKEMASEEQMLDQSITSNAVLIQYIQDLYRFFKLYPHRGEFDDVFQHEMMFGKFDFYNNLFYRQTLMDCIAVFHFEKNNYLQAIEAYLLLMDKTGPRHEYFEKIGYCYQKTENYAKAVEYYKKAELFDADRQWILKKLGWCSIKMMNYSEALRYFNDAAAIQPDDLTIQLQIGQCLLHLNDYEKALHHYLKLRFFAPDNLKVLRPAAWCHFLLGQTRQALELYAEILGQTSNPSAYDLMNAGHVNLCLGNRKEALSLYRQSLSLPSANKVELIAAFTDDAPALIKNGISPFEIPLIRDYLRFQTDI